MTVERTLTWGCHESLARVIFDISRTAEFQGKRQLILDIGNQGIQLSIDLDTLRDQDEMGTAASLVVGLNLRAGGIQPTYSFFDVLRHMNDLSYI